jgi:hypothetical protein
MLCSAYVWYMKVGGLMQNMYSMECMMVICVWWVDVLVMNTFSLCSVEFDSA